MQTAFRIEHMDAINPSSGHYEGPFQGEFDGIQYYRDHMDDGPDPADHPVPSDDGIKSLTEEFVFGAMWMDELLSWFPCENGREAMRDAGFVIREYKTAIQDHHIGSYQVAFCGKFAKCITQFDLMTLEVI